MTNIIDIEIDKYALDTRSGDHTPTDGNESPEVWKTSYHMEINPWLMLFGAVVIVPICIYLGLLALVASGLITTMPLVLP